MNKICILLISLLLLACNDKTDWRLKSSTSLLTHQGQITGDTINIERTSAKIYWKGTKMLGLGKHEGMIDLRSGYFLIDDNKIVGGEIIVDMISISITDIPVYEPIPRRNLKNHLLSSDFFNADKYPLAKLKIKETHQKGIDSLILLGDLSIKDRTHPVKISAIYKNQRFTSKFSFNRFKWNIHYEGNWIERTVVDPNIQLQIDIKLSK